MELSEYGASIDKYLRKGDLNALLRALRYGDMDLDTIPDVIELSDLNPETTPYRTNTWNEVFEPKLFPLL